MKQRKLTIMALAAGLGLMASGSQVQAFPLSIDDFNFATGATATDSFPVDAVGVTVPAGTGGSVYQDWSRTPITAWLTAGRTVSTIDCVNCQMGHFTAQSNSYGWGHWDWTGKSIEGITDFEMLYSTDVFGADVIVSFDVDGKKVAQFQSSDLQSTGGVLTPFHIDVPGISQLDITSIHLHVFSNGGNYTDPTGWLGDLNLGAQATNLDFNVDNVTVTGVPEPATMALMGLGLAAFGWSRRKSA